MITEILSEISDDSNIAEFFPKAKNFWKEFFSQYAKKSEEDMSKLLGEAQFKFCSLLPKEKYSFSKSMMALTAIYYIYSQRSDGFYKDFRGKYYNEKEVELAKKVLRAFAYSSVSIEVKNNLNKIAEAFSLEKDPAYDQQPAR